jgi:hypothetical protein
MGQAPASLGRSAGLPFSDRAVVRLLVRFILLSLVLGSCAWRAEQTLSAALLPLLRVEIQWMDDVFRVDRLYLARDDGEPVVRLEVGLARTLTVNGRTYYPDPRGSAVSSTLLGNVTLPTVLLIAIVFAVPGTGVFAGMRRLLAMLPALLVLWTLGAPMILLAGLWRVVFAVAGSPPFSALLLWSDFLQAGGQNVLAIGLGMLAAWGATPRVCDRYARQEDSQQSAGPER